MKKTNKITMFCLLHAVSRGTEALVYIDHPMSGYNIQADCQRRTMAPPLNSGANVASALVQALVWPW